MADDAMTENVPNNKTGVWITLQEIYEGVKELSAKLDSQMDRTKEELTKLKVQVASLYVVNGIMASVIVFLAQRGLSL